MSRSRRGAGVASYEAQAGWLFISPWIIGFLIFTAGPSVASMLLSFTDYALVGETHAVGTANYARLVEAPRVAKSLTNIFVYALMFVPLGTVVTGGPGQRPAPAPGSGPPQWGRTLAALYERDPTSAVFRPARRAAFATQPVRTRLDHGFDAQPSR